MLGQTLLRYYLAPLLYSVRKVWRQEATVFASCLAVCSLNKHMYPMSDTRSWILKLYICKLPHVKYFGVAKIWGGKVLLKVICDHVHTVFATERVVASESPPCPPPAFLGCLFFFPLCVFFVFTQTEGGLGSFLGFLTDVFVINSYYINETYFPKMKQNQSSVCKSTNRK